jgi:hypothetical protein
MWFTQQGSGNNKVVIMVSIWCSTEKQLFIVFNLGIVAPIKRKNILVNIIASSRRNTCSPLSIKWQEAHDNMTSWLIEDPCAALMY